MSGDRIGIHELGVLRAAVEGVSLGTYLGSTIEIDHWREALIERGLIAENCRATAGGYALAAELHLSDQPKCRAYLWPIATEAGR